MALILTVMFIGDHSRVLPGYRHQIVILDRAISNETLLRARLAEVLDARIHSATVSELDLVNDKTIVDVRYETPTNSMQADRTSTVTPSTTATPITDSSVGTIYYTNLPETMPAGDPTYVPSLRDDPDGVVRYSDDRASSAQQTVEVR